MYHKTKKATPKDGLDFYTKTTRNVCISLLKTSELHLGL